MIACTLNDCPPGLFIFGNCLGFKTEYRNEKGSPDAYVVTSGEFFWGGASNYETRDALMVTPVEITNASALRLVGVEDEE